MFESYDLDVELAKFKVLWSPCNSSEVRSLSNLVYLSIVFVMELSIFLGDAYLRQNVTLKLAFRS